MSGFFSQPRAVWAVASAQSPTSAEPPTSEVLYQLSHVGPLAPGV